jgi:dsRNA-specific ribonuclease
VLEFLGDSLLDYYVTDYFVTEYTVKKKLGFFSGQDEGTLTTLRSQYTCNDYLRERCRKWNISQYLRVADQKELKNEKIDADLLESLIGAIYLDSGKSEKVTREFILRVLNLDPCVPEETVKIPAKNVTPTKVTPQAKSTSSQTQLESECRQRGYQKPIYKILKHQGGKPSVSCSIKELKEKGHRCACAETEEKAKEKAAAMLLKELTGHPPKTSVQSSAPPVNLLQAKPKNAISMLTEHCQKNQLKKPKFTVTKDEVSKKNKHTFHVTCQVSSFSTKGTGPTKKDAERQAAIAMLCDVFKAARR